MPEINADGEECTEEYCERWGYQCESVHPSCPVVKYGREKGGELAWGNYQENKKPLLKFTKLTSDDISTHLYLYGNYSKQEGIDIKKRFIKTFEWEAEK